MVSMAFRNVKCSTACYLAVLCMTVPLQSCHGMRSLSRVHFSHERMVLVLLRIELTSMWRFGPARALWCARSIRSVPYVPPPYSSSVTDTLALPTMTGLEHGLIKILEAKCADVGSKFSLVGPSKVLAQPSQRYLFAKLSRDVPQVIGEAKSLEAMADASESDKDSTHSLIPRVYASGKTEDGSKAYLVTDYLDMRGRLGAKSQRQLGEQLAKMHKNGTSPDGRFGFEVPTFCGATVGK